MRLARHHLIAILLAIILLLIVFAAGPAGGQETGSPDDSTACTEKWVCEAGSECHDGFRDIFCHDLNQCGTDAQKPPVEIPCDPGYQDDGCSERWVCTPWSECWSDGLERMTCEDANACVPGNAELSYTRNCAGPEPPSCEPSWDCDEWSPCLNGTSHRQCRDTSECVQESLYRTETASCTSTGPPPACEPEWDCAEWSDCVQDHMIRQCLDRNGCGTIEGRPEQTMPCDTASPPPDETCSEEWACTQWTECDGQLRHRMCRDLSECGEPERKEQETCQTQCFEKWECGPWSECLGGSQKRQCSDASSCASMLPVMESRSCSMPSQPPANQTSPPNATQQPPASGTPSNGTLPPASGTEAESGRTFSEIAPEEPARLFPDSPDSSVSQISVRTRTRIKNASIMLSETISPPPEIPPEPPGREVFRYLNISKENIADEDIGNATVDFQVTKEWLREKLINVSTVKLRRYSGGQWNDLPTSVLYDDSESFHYRAYTPGFSIFAIAGEFMLEKSGGGMMCLPLDVRCYGSEVQECAIDGLSWTITEECEYGCVSPGACRTEPAEQSPVAGEDYVMMLMIALLAVIVVLGFVVMFFKIKRKKISQELSSPVITPGSGG